MAELSIKFFISGHMVQNSVNIFKNHELKGINAFAVKV